MARAEKEPNPALDYAQAVVAGEIVAGRYVRLACERHLNDLETCKKRGLDFDVPAGNRAIEFLEHLHHYEGRWARPPAGQPRCSCATDFDNCPTRLRLSPHQKFEVASIFGWKRDDGFRRFRIVYKEVARKEGKSFLAGGIGGYMFCADGESGPQVWCAATKTEQASIIYRSFKQSARITPGIAGEIDGLWAKLDRALSIPRRNATFRVEGAHASTMDGLNPHCTLVDEYHAHKNREVVNVFESAMGAREQPLLYKVTTAGIRVEGSPCKAEHDRCVRILEGRAEDDQTFALIFNLDENDDWRDPEVWPKANPNFGITIKPDDFAAAQKRAEEDPELENDFKTKRLCMWVGQAKRYIAIDRWNACPRDLDPKAMYGRPAYGGLDLGQIDLSALALWFPPDNPESNEPWGLRVWAWSPEEALRDRVYADHRRWAAEGYITVTEGNETDFEAIRQTIMTLSELYDLRGIGYDPFRAPYLALRLQEETGVFVLKCPPTKLHADTEKFKALADSGRIRHEGNPALDSAVDHLVVRKNAEGIVKPDKEKATNKIDLAVSSIFGLHLQAGAPPSKKSRYNDPDQEALSA